jgi:PAS domain S-box-containing protein
MERGEAPKVAEVRSASAGSPPRWVGLAALAVVMLLAAGFGWWTSLDGVPASASGMPARNAWAAGLALAAALLGLLGGLWLGNLSAGRKERQRQASAEGALNDGDRRLHALTQKAGEFVTVLDARCRIIQPISGRRDLLGYAAGEVVGHEVFAYLHPEELPAVQRALQHLLDQPGGTTQMEVRVRAKDGAWRWFAIAAANLLHDPAVGGLVLNAHDLTERKLAEQAVARDLDAMTHLQRLGALSAQEGNLETVLTEVVDAAMAISGADFGNIQLLDPASGDLRIAAQRGFPPWWLEFWNSVAKGRGACGTALERGERIVVEDVEQSPIFVGTPALEIQRRAGVRAVQSTPLLSRSGKPIGMFSTHYRSPRRPDDRALRLLDLLAGQAADIIQHARAEAALRESEARLHALLDGSPDPIFLKDREGRLLLANPATFAVIGRPPEACLGKTDEEFYEGPPRPASARPTRSFTTTPPMAAPSWPTIGASWRRARRKPSSRRSTPHRGPATTAATKRPTGTPRATSSA